MKTARASIQGIEVMRLFKKGQFDAWLCTPNEMQSTLLISSLASLLEITTKSGKL